MAHRREGIDSARVRFVEPHTRPRIAHPHPPANARTRDRGSAGAAAGIHIYYLCCASVVLFAAGCQVGLVQGGFSPPAVWECLLWSPGFSGRSPFAFVSFGRCSIMSVH